MTEYIGTELKKTIDVSKLYTVHYFEYCADFSFTGESHDFWEFVYVDKGTVIATAGENDVAVNQGEVIFHKPNEWHNIRTNFDEAANVAIITFSSDSEAMTFFENKVLKVGQRQKTLISNMIAEFTNAFSTPLNDFYTDNLTRCEDANYMSEQLLELYLCEFLLLFLKNDISKQDTLININYENSMLNMLVSYMNSRLTEHITTENLVKYSGSNKTTVNNIFKAEFNMSPIRYFLQLKTELAKKYLRENNYNVTQISDILGYSNIHYFSRQFKKITGMSPIQYSRSIKAMNTKI